MVTKTGSIGKYKITVFCVVPKKVVLLKISKAREPLEKSLAPCKGGRKCKI